MSARTAARGRYAWGRSVAREDVVAATERLLALSGQFAQRRLARPSHQLELLDAFVGPEQATRRREARDAWRALQAATRRVAELEEGAEAERAASRGARRPGRGHGRSSLPGEEDALRREAERSRHVTELADGVSACPGRDRPRGGRRRARPCRGGRAARSSEPARVALRSSSAATEELRDAAVRLGEVASDLRRFADALDGDPARVAEVEERLDRIAGLRRRYRAADLDELLARRDAALPELEAIAGGADPVERARSEREVAQRGYRRRGTCARCRAARCRG